MGGSTSYAKGDKISVIKGELNTMKGTVLSIDEGFVQFKPIGFDKITKPLRIEVSNIAKYFEASDQVRVTEGKYKGETGRVIDVEGRKVSVVLDKKQQEISIPANFLKLRSDTDMPTDSNLIGSAGLRHGYTANDLVTYNGGKNAGLVLQVHEDYLKVINEQGKNENVKVVDIGKKLPPPRRGGNLSGRDAKGNALAHDSMIKCTNGPKKGLIAPIKHAFRNYLFLWHKDFVQSNGIFVENCRNVIILGGEYMKGSQGQAIASQNRLVKDKLVGKQVVIIGG